MHFRQLICGMNKFKFQAKERAEDMYANNAAHSVFT